ncbi:Wzz/FepE/Etk N-terminal domain-containing protein [Halobacillus salinarum]|uniref:Wzz/FepE/Etk N-terminal domain-containing protein n=1 Tax=Halobacillus salinarum TaxID=2932257 RepID=A0ABY4EMT1_9BACI|nr:Wzz/FepE/Etk N-terminal domain-containing protein [Halobacillus salinarum]UOQ45690.1 Wzz/FepE/Etk N-terminal domain-containing protein [Halobacillus salinarum]
MEETISLKEIGQVLKKRWLMIASLAIGALVIAALVSYFVLTPTYQASSQFIVNTKQNQSDSQFDVNDIRTNVELINTYNVIIKSPAILEEVVQEADLAVGADTLSQKLQVSSEQDSQVVTVTVTDTSQETAAVIANSVVEVFKDKVPKYMNVDNVTTLSDAEIASNPSPVSPKPYLNMAIALVVGLMVGVGLAFLLEYLDNTIKTEDELEQKIGLPVLGSIAHITEEDLPKTVNRDVSPRQKRGVKYAQQEKKTV